MRPIPTFLAMLPLAGCGAYWDIPDDAKPLKYDGCTQALNWYPDCDLDGFGVPIGGGAIVVDCAGNLTEADGAAAGCSGVAGAIPLASNQLDCKEDDPAITGDFGICPEGIGPGSVYDPDEEAWVPAPPSGNFAGAIVEGSELVAMLPPSEAISSADAIVSCTAWAGAVGDPELHHGLARLSTRSPELDAFLALLAGGNGVPADAVTALWIDLSLDPNTGDWNYDGEGIAPQDFDRCDAQNPTLADFWPEINPNLIEDPEPGARGPERLALLKFADSETWCWGAPGRYPEEGFDPRMAMALCQRPKPDPARSAEVASE